MDISAEAEREFSLPPPFCSIQTRSGLDDAHPTGEGDLFTHSTDLNANLLQRLPQ